MTSSQNDVNFNPLLGTEELQEKGLTFAEVVKLFIFEGKHKFIQD